MSANKKTIRAELRTQFQKWIKQSGRANYSTMEDIAEMLMADGGVDRELVFQVFGRAGFVDWIRGEAKKNDPTTGRPVLTMVGPAMTEDESGAQVPTQQMLYVQTKWANYDGRVFDFRQKVAAHERDRRAARILWQNILEDFPEDARRNDAYRPPPWLFDLDEDAGEVG